MNVLRYIFKVFSYTKRKLLNLKMSPKDIKLESSRKETTCNKDDYKILKR